MKHHTQRPGFTLLEMIITMVIISTILGSSFVLLQSTSDDRLTDLSLDTQTLAKRTLIAAKSQQRPHYLIITSSAIWATPIQPTKEDTERNLTPTKDAIKIPEDVAIDFRPVGDEQWYRIKRDSAPYVWVFSRSGLSQKVGIRFSSEGDMYESTFHPLTAGETVE